MRVLLTGFAPFGGEKVNPSWEAVRLVRAEWEGLEVKKLELPTAFGESLSLLTEAVRELRPDVVLCTGQAGGRDRITVERVAVNIKDAEFPDNRGYQPAGEAIEAAGPAAYFSTVPVKGIVEAVQKEGIPCRISNSAGTFVCNQLLYGILHYGALHAPELRAGFIHVPYLPEQAAGKDKPEPSMTLGEMKRALEAALGYFAV